MCIEERPKHYYQAVKVLYFERTVSLEKAVLAFILVLEFSLYATARAAFVQGLSEKKLRSMGAESQQEINHPQSAGGRDECDIRSNTDLLLSKNLPIKLL